MTMNLRSHADLTDRARSLVSSAHDSEMISLEGLTERDVVVVVQYLSGLVAGVVEALREGDSFDEVLDGLLSMPSGSGDLVADMAAIANR